MRRASSERFTGRGMAEREIVAAASGSQPPQHVNHSGWAKADFGVFEAAVDRAKDGAVIDQEHRGFRAVPRRARRSGHRDEETGAVCAGYEPFPSADVSPASRFDGSRSKQAGFRSRAQSGLGHRERRTVFARSERSELASLPFNQWLPAQEGERFPRPACDVERCGAEE